MLRAWRIVKEKYAATAFDGEGARRAGGRFNSRGSRVVYASDSLALALLEIAVSVPDYRALQGRIYFEIVFPEEVVETLDRDAMPRDWAAAPPSRSTQVIGDRWLQEARTAVLRVPSVIVPGASNFLLNPAHAAFAAIDVPDPQPLKVDPRLIK